MCTARKITEDLFITVFTVFGILPDGKIPKDSTNVIHMEEVIPPSIYITMCVCASMGIVLAVSLFAFNVVFRANRYGCPLTHVT